MIPVATATSNRPPHHAKSAERGRLDSKRSGEDQDGEQNIDALVRGQPRQGRRNSEADSRGHEHTDQFRVGAEQRAKPGHELIHFSRRPPRARTRRCRPSTRSAIMMAPSALR